ncbi:MAG: hypothetical protein IJK64_02125 [Clostridia bacterium]|nr:hypothetical protein [Clostridia bacterium]
MLSGDDCFAGLIAVRDQEAAEALLAAQGKNDCLGSAAAIEAADLVITDDDLRRLPTVMRKA